jgi:hypothetical protein
MILEFNSPFVYDIDTNDGEVALSAYEKVFENPLVVNRLTDQIRSMEREGHSFC